MTEPATNRESPEDGALAPPAAAPKPKAAPSAETAKRGESAVSSSLPSQGSSTDAEVEDTPAWLAGETFWQTILRRVIAVLLTAHVVAILAWSVPGEAPLVKKVRHFFEDYVLYTGVWQSWDMFSPNPMSINAYLEAEMIMTDGSKKVWAFPRMDKMGVFDKFRYERYRKWAIDRVRLDAYSGIWPETSKYIARLYYNDPAGPPKEISIWRHWREIKPPNQKWVPLGKEDAMLDEQNYKFYTYTVRPEDIEPPPPGGVR